MSTSKLVKVTIYAQVFADPVPLALALPLPQRTMLAIFCSSLASPDYPARLDHRILSKDSNDCKCRVEEHERVAH